MFAAICSFIQIMCLIFLLNVLLVSSFKFSNYVFSSVDVPSRRWSAKSRSLGIFQGAQVVRGADWTWGNQDGMYFSELLIVKGVILLDHHTAGLQTAMF